jgi:AcrR family transcriptional regulator
MDPGQEPTAHTSTGRTPVSSTGADRRALRRERLLTTATGLFATRGYATTSIERICSTAHVSIRAFYEEFESREALLIALHDVVSQAGMDAAHAALLDPVTRDAGTRARITALVRAYVGAVTADPAAARVAFVEVAGAGSAAEQHRVLWRSLWADFMTGEAERAVGRGEAERRDRTLTVVGVIGAVNELVAHWARNSAPLSQEPLSRESLAGELIHHILAVLGVGAESQEVTR